MYILDPYLAYDTDRAKERNGEGRRMTVYSTDVLMLGKRDLVLGIRKEMGMRSLAYEDKRAHWVQDPIGEAHVK